MVAVKVSLWANDLAANSAESSVVNLVLRMVPKMVGMLVVKMAL
jgi:hypothetical protein